MTNSMAWKKIIETTSLINKIKGKFKLTKSQTEKSGITQTYVLMTEMLF